MNRDLIWVNESNEITGYGEKLYTHRINQLHRAFSIFIYNIETGKLLMQKRAEGKYHSGGKWSNSCCSHPYRGEDWGRALVRCIRDELCSDFSESRWAKDLMLLSTDMEPSFSPGSAMQYAGRFCYNSHYSDLSEHEMDHVFVLSVNQEQASLLSANPEEIAALAWRSVSELEENLTSSPSSFSSWFLPAFSLARTKM